MKTTLSEVDRHHWLEKETDRQLDAYGVQYAPAICWHSERGEFEAWLMWPDEFGWERVFVPDVEALPDRVVARILARLGSGN